ncbi:decarboxylating cobalt-precorrin-6B (C(15))-methyltransferase [Martelella alba]|uniref:Decarboxylating cobalt-precorrin-6B (C(15))-methyltransferase n=1 Tax=Martelella alba TaxID=2590451 RepID=A0ABY2SQK1_9HYPH|nr:decarboxylating cobalt-precorrin-6B (C(15))-methyltransferase [Martelella alba]TKI08037.1 decarboxylating cobalt-precorrin-6B (C(15))-methyltransferase [Martelella alba]
MRDDEFIRGSVPMTKREVRQAALDRLALDNARLLVDVGAGTGSISVEAACRHPALKVVAVERDPEALALIGRNCRRFGLKRVDILPGEAPLPLAVQADAVFIGGSGGRLGDIIRWADTLLAPGGRLVVNLILLENLREALDCLTAGRFDQLECIQMQISALAGLGGGHYFKPNNPAYILSCQKEKPHDGVF